jgi:hypothetical protein
LKISNEKIKDCVPEIPGSSRASGANASPARTSGASPETFAEIHYSKRRLPHFERPWANVVDQNEDYPWLWTQELSSAGVPKTAREARAFPNL